MTVIIFILKFSVGVSVIIRFNKTIKDIKISMGQACGDGVVSLCVWDVYSDDSYDLRRCCVLCLYKTRNWMGFIGEGKT